MSTLLRLTVATVALAVIVAGVVATILLALEASP